MSAEDHVSDYTDLEAGEEPTMMPARPMKKGLSKRKAGGFGKKGKVFASVDKMLQLVDAVNDVQDKKVNALIERDIEVSKRLAQREASKKHRQESKKKSLEKVKEDLKSGAERPERPGKPGKKGKPSKGGDRPAKKAEKQTRTGKPSSGNVPKKGGKGAPSKGGKKKVSFK